MIFEVVGCIKKLEGLVNRKTRKLVQLSGLETAANIIHVIALFCLGMRIGNFNIPPRSMLLRYRTFRSTLSVKLIAQLRLLNMCNRYPTSCAIDKKIWDTCNNSSSILVVLGYSLCTKAQRSLKKIKIVNCFYNIIYKLFS